MQSRFVLLRSKVTAEQFGAEQEYFNVNIKRKKLEIIYESNSGYIRVRDQQGEDFGLFSWQYKEVQEKKNL